MESNILILILLNSHMKKKIEWQFSIFNNN